MSRSQPILLLVTLLPLLSLASCTTVPETQTQRLELKDESRDALKSMEARDANLRALLDQSAGYAVFPNVGKGGFIVGGAFGRGSVYDRAGQFLGFARMTQGSVGGVVGGRNFALLLVFQTDADLQRFTNGSDFTLGAEATAIAIDHGASNHTAYNNGVAVFSMPIGGLMADASLSGQSFRFETGPATAGETPATSPVRSPTTK